MWKTVNQIRILFTPADKLRFLGVSGLMLLAALLEMLGIGLLVSAAALILAPEQFSSRQIVRQIFEASGFETQHAFVIAVLLAIGAFLLAKNGFLLWVCRRQSQFVYRKGAELNVRLYANYLNAPYGSSLHRSTAELNTNMSRINQLISGVMLPAMQVLADGLVIVLLGLTLIATMPLITLGGVAFMGITALSLSALLRRRNQASGRDLADATLVSEKYRLAGLFGLKFVKARAAEAFFIRQYQAVQGKVSRSFSVLYVLGQVPRLALESAAMLLMLGILIVMLARQMPPETILLLFSMILAVMSRLLPALSRCNYNLTMIRQSQYLFDVLFEDFVALPQEKNGDGAPITFVDAIEFRHLSFQYPDGTPVLKDFNFRITANQSIGIAGPTGGGKTTLADLLLGLLTPTEGAILADGRDIRENLVSWRRQIGYVPQHIHLLEDTIRANVAFGIPAEEIDDARVAEVLKLAQLAETVEALSGGVHYRLTDNGNNLSGGQRQRLGIARALYHRPTLLILDEATSALDHETETAFTEALESLHGQLTMFVIAHRLTTLEKCDQICKLNGQ